MRSSGTSSYAPPPRFPRHCPRAVRQNLPHPTLRLQAHVPVRDGSQLLLHHQDQPAVASLRCLILSADR